MKTVRCNSTQDVVEAIANTRGERVAIRGGGLCFAGRSSAGDVILDMSGLDEITVDADIATIGAGARLAQVYATLHTFGRTLPAGCGPTVGIAGLTLGGGIGLLGRQYGLTCDSFIGAQVVLADGTVVTCDDNHDPDLFWALRGAGGGQFGVVTALRFDTVPEPLTTRIEAHWPSAPVDELLATWQHWAPHAPNELTANLSIRPNGTATLIGAATLDETTTRDLLHELTDKPVDLQGNMPFSQVKATFGDPRDAPAVRIRSEFFARPLTDHTRTALLAQLDKPGRQLSFTAMNGAYNQRPEQATAFAHRNEHFLLEHISTPADPWIDQSWATTHPEGSGRVYPNFPDPALPNWPTAYHGTNQPRLAKIKQTYEPTRTFDFPQAITGQTT